MLRRRNKFVVNPNGRFLAGVAVAEPDVMRSCDVLRISIVAQKNLTRRHSSKMRHKSRLLRVIQFLIGANRLEQFGEMVSPHRGGVTLVRDFAGKNVAPE